MAPVTIGVSLKTYFGRQRARIWFAHIAERLRECTAVADGAVEVVIIPTYLQLDDALTAFVGTGASVGAQDVSAFPAGAYTGEVAASELAESHVVFAEIGHAERRRLFGETDEVIAAKAAAALDHGITPVLCLGETERQDATAAAASAITQLRADLDGAPAGRIVVAYEPVWAIGAPEPAPTEHITAVTRAIRAKLDAEPNRHGSAVLYGGSAGPGLLTQLGDDVDGLFLGRFAHDPDAFDAVLAEAATLAKQRTRWTS